MSPERRTLAGRLLAAFAGLTAVPARTAAAAAPAARSVPKAAYHLAAAERVEVALNDIENHFAVMGGPTRIHLALIVHGTALTAFAAAEADPELARRLSALVAMGLDLGACADTLAAHRLEIGQLLPGFVAVPEGGVVRLARLQAQGYAYLRP